MKQNQLSKVGMLLSVLPLLTLIGVVAYLVLAHARSGIFLLFFGAFTYFPALVVYLIYLAVRFRRQSTSISGLKQLTVINFLLVLIPVIFLFLGLGASFLFLGTPVVLPLAELIFYLGWKKQG